MMKEKLEQLLVKWKNNHERLLDEYEVEEVSGVKDCITDLENLLNGGECE